MALTAQGVQVLRLADVWKSFDGVDAVKGVTFEAQAGEIHALLGENGAGKSTLMAIASGSLAPDAGRIAIRGSEVGSLTPMHAARLGLRIVHQHPALLPDLTVAENLKLAALGVKASALWIREQLARVGCNVDLGARLVDLSTAERQQIEIAKALAAEPKILIL